MSRIKTRFTAVLIAAFVSVFLVACDGGTTDVEPTPVPTGACAPDFDWGYNMVDRDYESPEVTIENVGVDLEVRRGCGLVVGDYLILTHFYLAEGANPSTEIMISDGVLQAKRSGSFGADFALFELKEPFKGELFPLEKLSEVGFDLTEEELDTLKWEVEHSSSL